MFGLAHRALDGVTLSATNRELTIAGFSKAATQGMEGVMIEVPRGLHWEGTFRELSLSNDNTSLLLSAAGTSSTNRGGAFYGPVGVKRTAGTSALQADFSGLRATGVVVEARMNGLPAGRLVSSVMGTLGTLAATNPTVLRCSASARDSTAGASFAFALAEGTTFTATAGGELIGDEFRLSPAAPGEVVGTLKHVILQGSGLDRLTLTNESTHAESPPVLVMEIERAGPGVVFSWPDVAHIYALEKRQLDAERWEWVALATYRYADFRMHGTLPQLTNTMGYFHLEHYFNHYIYSVQP
jgi:hypothetical protein